MGPIRSPSGESARHEDAQKRLISATAAAQKRRVGGLAYESPAALRGWRSGEQAGTCSAVLGAAGESRERGRGWPPRAAKAKYRTILRRSERKAVSWLWGGAVLRGPGAPSCRRHALSGRTSTRPCQRSAAAPTSIAWTRPHIQNQDLEAPYRLRPPAPAPKQEPPTKARVVTGKLCAVISDCRTEVVRLRNERAKGDRPSNVLPSKAASLRGRPVFPCLLCVSYDMVCK